MKVQIETIDVQFNEELNCVFMHVKTYSSPEQIRIGAVKALEMFNGQNATSVFVKQTNPEEPNFIQSNWVIDEWFPQLVSNGLKQYALVVPPAFYNTLQPQVRQTKIGNVYYGYFTTDAEALKWLKTKK